VILTRVIACTPGPDLQYHQTACHRMVFMQNLGTRFGIVTFFPVLVLAALYAGSQVGLLVATLSVALMMYLSTEASGTLSINDSATLVGIVIFFLSALIRTL
jgi:K+-sensing histidine kinase KdpD